MAHGARTLQYVDQTPRPLFGLSLAEACAVLVAFYLARQVLPHALLRGTAALVPPAFLWGALLLTHRVRWEAFGDQLYGFAVRRVLGWPRITPWPYALIEVDGFTRDALTEEQQDVRLIARLQGMLASLGAGAAVQLLVTNQSLG